MKNEIGGMGLNTTTITFNSVTYAIKAKKLLERVGINSKIAKMTEGKQGCLYGISVINEVFFDAVVILKGNGIEYSVYQK